MPHGHESVSAPNIPTVPNEEARNIAASFLESPTTFSECIRTNAS